MKFAQFLAVGIAMASAAAFAGGNHPRSSQSSEQQSAPSSDQRAQTSQGQGASQDQDTIKQAQEQLSAMGHDAGPADGIVGPKTQAAVKEFQESKGLQASGQLDNQTLAALQTGGNEGAPRGQSSSGQSSGQSMSSQPSGAPSSSDASPSRDTQAAAPSSSGQSKY